MSKLSRDKGKRYGLLTVIKEAQRIKGHAMLTCECDCGNVKTFRVAHLEQGVSKSCGCRIRKHGMHKTITYKSWSGMLHRCNCKSASSYARYGGRGIKVCNRWKSFSRFIKDMGKRPNPSYSLDRINVNGNYEPNNCRWVKNDIQQNNKCNTVYLTAFGEKKPITSWIKDPRCKLSASGLRKRIAKGWSHEKALTYSPYAN